MKTWDGKAAVVTGGASGIGLALAHGLVRRGVRVVIADIEEDPLRAAAAELNAAGGQVEGFRADVSDFAQMQKLAEFCKETVGHIHLLFNNAGVLSMGPTWELTLDDWRWVWGVNVHGVIHGIKSFLPAMLEHGQESYVVNTASLAAFSGHGDYAPYCASKAAVLSITQSLYSEMRAMMTQVGVSVVCPGVIRSRIHESWRNQPAGHTAWSRRDIDDDARREGNRAYNARGGTPEDVAEAVFAAMLEDRFYIFVGDQTQKFVRAGVERAIEGKNPVVSTWGVDLRPVAEREWNW